MISFCLNNSVSSVYWMLAKDDLLDAPNPTII